MSPVLLGLIPDLIGKAVDIFDRKFQSDAEREQAKREFESLATKELQSAWESEQKNLTERHKNDMQSDSWLSKNIRPMALVYLMGLFTLAFFNDVPETVLEMLRDLLMTVFIFYFGARSLEKVAKMVKDGK
jgi:hypothetical protein